MMKASTIRMHTSQGVFYIAMIQEYNIRMQGSMCVGLSIGDGIMHGIYDCI